MVDARLDYALLATAGPVSLALLVLARSRLAADEVTDSIAGLVAGPVTLLQGVPFAGLSFHWTITGPRRGVTRAVLRPCLARRDSLTRAVAGAVTGCPRTVPGLGLRLGLGLVCATGASALLSRALGLTRGDHRSSATVSPLGGCVCRAGQHQRQDRDRSQNDEDPPLSHVIDLLEVAGRNGP